LTISAKKIMIEFSLQETPPIYQSKIDVESTVLQLQSY